MGSFSYFSIILGFGLVGLGIWDFPGIRVLSRNQKEKCLLPQRGNFDVGLGSGSEIGILEF